MDGVQPKEWIVIHVRFPSMCVFREARRFPGNSARVAQGKKWGPRRLVASLGMVILALGALPLFIGWAQRRLLYPSPVANKTFARAPFELLDIPGPSGDTVHALFHSAQEGKPTVVTFHGNGEQLSDILPWLFELQHSGFGSMAVEYPGYGLSNSGVACEEEIYVHAERALNHLQSALKIPDGRVVLLGESLGSGVAVEMARRGHGSGLVLVSPFTSIPQLAIRLLPWLPFPKLLPDRYDSASKAPHVQVPTLVLHGSNDGLVPPEMGRELAGYFPRATFSLLEGVGHGGILSVYAEQVLARVEAWYASEKRGSRRGDRG